jgi:hypothetical protein
MANVLPIFKKADQTNPENYRPISLLSCVGKVFERVIFNHLYNYLNINNLISSQQAGFIPGYSTTYQLIETYNDITTSLENKEHVGIVFLDISKAFDRVWHRGLFHKLRENGVGENMIKLLTSYLSKRLEYHKDRYSDLYFS